MSDLRELPERLLRVGAAAALDEIGDLREFEAVYGVEPVGAITEALVATWAKRGLDPERLYPIAYSVVADVLLGGVDAA